MLISRCEDENYRVQRAGDQRATLISKELGESLTDDYQCFDCGDDYRCIWNKCSGGYIYVSRAIIDPITLDWQTTEVRTNIKYGTSSSESVTTIELVGNHRPYINVTYIDINGVNRHTLTVNKIRFNDGNAIVDDALEYTLEKAPWSTYSVYDPVYMREYVFYLTKDYILIDVYSGLRIQDLRETVNAIHIAVYGGIVTIFADRMIRRYDDNGNLISCTCYDYYHVACTTDACFVTFIACIGSSPTQTVQYKIGLYDLRTCDVYLTEVTTGVKYIANLRLLPTVPRFCVNYYLICSFA